MAKVRQNVVMNGLSGMLGDQIVIRQDKAGRTIVGVKPSFDENRVFSEAQKNVQGQFREATAYAKQAKDNEVYAAKAEGTPQNPYNVAVADWFHAPEILDIDLAAWNGEAGKTLRIKTMDDVKVKQVTLVITDESGTVLEQGAATQADGLWWHYVTTAAASGNPKVLVSVEDLPGHITQMTKNK